MLPRLVMLVSFRVPLAHLWMDFHSFSHWMWRSSFAFWHNVFCGNNIGSESSFVANKQFDVPGPVHFYTSTYATYTLLTHSTKLTPTWNLNMQHWYSIGWKPPSCPTGLFILFPLIHELHFRICQCNTNASQCITYIRAFSKRILATPQQLSNSGNGAPPYK